MGATGGAESSHSQMPKFFIRRVISLKIPSSSLAETPSTRSATWQRHGQVHRCACVRGVVCGRWGCAGSIAPPCTLAACLGPAQRSLCLHHHPREEVRKRILKNSRKGVSKAFLVAIESGRKVFSLLHLYSYCYNSSSSFLVLS